MYVYLIPGHLLVDPIKQPISCACIINHMYITFLLFRFPTTAYKFRRRAPKEHRIMTNRKLITKLSIYLCCQKSEQKYANYQGCFFINGKPYLTNNLKKMCVPLMHNLPLSIILFQDALHQVR